MSQIRFNEIASPGERMVRGNLIAARALHVLDGQDHYGNVVQAEVVDSGLEIHIAEARGPFSPATAAVMAQANQAAQAAYDTAMQPVRQRRAQIGALLQTIETVMAGPRDQQTVTGIQQNLRLLRSLAIVDVSINYADVRADNTRLRHEAQQLVSQGELAAMPVTEFLDDILQAQGPRGQIPLGVEHGVRDYFFVNNLLRGEAWGYLFSETGLLLLEGGKHNEALGELAMAVQLGYDDPSVKLGIGEAYQGLGDTGQAIGAYTAALADSPMNPEALEALTGLHRQKAAQTRRRVEPQVVPYAAMVDARDNLGPEEIQASSATQQQKASQLYTLGAAYLSIKPVHPSLGLELLQKSLALDPNRKETHLWIADACSTLRYAAGTQPSLSQQDYSPLGALLASVPGPSQIMRRGLSAVRRAMT
ncbi:hypothetical protein HYU17_01995 [Candidatus Woesearchaeota archaeon]|nr:hypothetical protein [Candidatus Woesearchaeota archaeon]